MLPRPDQQASLWTVADPALGSVGVREVGTTSGALARLCRPCPEWTLDSRCRPLPEASPRQRTGRAAAIDQGENRRGALVTGEDAGRLRGDSSSAGPAEHPERSRGWPGWTLPYPER